MSRKQAIASLLLAWISVFLLAQSSLWPAAKILMASGNTLQEEVDNGALAVERPISVTVLQLTGLGGASIEEPLDMTVRAHRDGLRFHVSGHDGDDFRARFGDRSVSVPPSSINLAPTPKRPSDRRRFVWLAHRPRPGGEDQTVLESSPNLPFDRIDEVAVLAEVQLPSEPGLAAEDPSAAASSEEVAAPTSNGFGGDVVGPQSATNDTPVCFDGTTGRLIQECAGSFIFSPLTAPLDVGGQSITANASATRETTPGGDGSNLINLVGETCVDRNFDGYYEECGVVDADGDGSGYVQCTGKDSPDPACKHASEVIYRDFIDDVNAMIYGTGPTGFRMAPDGVIRLRDATVYVDFPCWSPGGANDPSDPSTHANTGGSGAAAYADCPVDDFGVKLFVLETGPWQGTIVGAGVDRRRNDQALIDERAAAGYADPARTIGTTIAMDRGNDLAPWFRATTGFVRGINFGVRVDPGPTTMGGTGAYHSDSDSKGYGNILEAIDPITDMNGTLCVCNKQSCSAPFDDWATSGANGKAGLAAGDVLWITTRIFTGRVNSLRRALRVRHADADLAYPSCSTGGVEIPIGGFEGSTSTTVGANVGFVRSVSVEQGQVIHPRSEALNGGARMQNLTIEAQDYWNEAGGDCSDTGVWQAGLETDDDCDSQPFFGVWAGAANGGLDGVVIKHHHEFSIDGGGPVAWATFNDVEWWYANGNPTGDSKGSWAFYRPQIRFSSFGVRPMFGGWGSVMRIRDLFVQATRAGSVVNLANQVEWDIDGVLIDGGSVTSPFLLQCGAERNYIRNVRRTGVFGAGSRMPMVWISCSDPDAPVRDNVIQQISDFPPRYRSGESLLLFEVDPFANGNRGAEAIYGNLFENFRSTGLDADSYMVSLIRYPDSNGVTAADLLQWNHFNDFSLDQGAGIFCESNAGSACVGPLTTGQKALGCGNTIGTGPAIRPDPDSVCAAGEMTETLAFCGAGPNATTPEYLGPSLDDGQSHLFGSAECDAQHSTTENVVAGIHFRGDVHLTGMECYIEAGGTDDVVTFELRADAAAVPGLACSVVVDGVNPQRCRVSPGVMPLLQGASSLAVEQLAEDEDLTALDSECKIFARY